jgi:hypothetical protein
MGRPHLHSHCNFAGSILKTVAKSFYLSCGSELTRQGTSLKYLLFVLFSEVILRSRLVDESVSFETWDILIISSTSVYRHTVRTISCISKKLWIYFALTYSLWGFSPVIQYIGILSRSDIAVWFFRQAQLESFAYYSDFSDLSEILPCWFTPPTNCHCTTYVARVLLDTEYFQHLVRFKNTPPSKATNFYHRTVIVTAAVHQSLDPRLVLSLRIRVTWSFNLLALGRCQPVYISFRISTDLCFC